MFIIPQIGCHTTLNSTLTQLASYNYAMHAC